MTPSAAPLTRAAALVMVFVSLAWGSSFLLIKEALAVTDPFGVALSRVALGAVVLGFLPGARRRVGRGAWPWIVALALVWMAIPLTLFAVAEQEISSATAGMINGSVPIFTAIVASLLARALPGRVRLAGLALGLLGILAIGVPGARTSPDAPLAVLLVVGAVTLYGVAFNITGWLQRRHGSLPVIFRSMAVAAVVLAPAGLPDLLAASPAPRGVLSMLLLGFVSTGAAFALFTWLAGTLDATRASVVTYAVPVVALLVGITVGGESAHPLAVAGVLLVVTAAYLVQRPEPPPSPAVPEGSPPQ